MIHIKKTGSLIILSLILTLQSSYAGEPKNYCQDPNSWKEWDALAEKYPNDKDVQILHALRIGLCEKIEQGSITLGMATNLFNRAHNLIIEKTRAEQKQKSKDL